LTTAERPRTYKPSIACASNMLMSKFEKPALPVCAEIACARVRSQRHLPSNPRVSERGGQIRRHVAPVRGGPFASANEDYYDLWSIELRASDSRLSNSHRSAVGGFTACLGPLALDHPLEMYATGTVARIPWVGVGECAALKSQPPVRTAIAFTCQLNLSGLPDAYSGGFLVSSTLAPFLGKNQPATAHVPGYLSTSVVTLRLWRKPPAVAKKP
jgi:hypothetical protein